MTDDFPADVKEFIRKHVHSLAQLEVLLMLHREPDRTWTAEEITKNLYLRSHMVAEILSDLVKRGFAVQTDTNYRYEVANEVDHPTIDRLARLYQERRVAVTTEIFSKPIDFIKAFSDAFRIRKEE